MVAPAPGLQRRDRGAVPGRGRRLRRPTGDDLLFAQGQLQPGGDRHARPGVDPAALRIRAIAGEAPVRDRNGDPRPDRATGSRGRVRREVARARPGGRLRVDRATAGDGVVRMEARPGGDDPADGVDRATLLRARVRVEDGPVDRDVAPEPGERALGVAAEGLAHVARLGPQCLPVVVRERDRDVGDARAVEDRGDERPVQHRVHAGVEHEAVDAFGELLREDGGGDERHRLDRRRHIADAIEALVSRGEIRHLDLHTKRLEHTKGWIPEKEPVRILISAGASCPDAMVEAVIRKIAGFFPNTREFSISERLHAA